VRVKVTRPIPAPSPPPEDLDLGSWALWYASRGWPVFPLGPRSKKPTRGSRGLLEATVDRERIERYWTRHPEANVALACGIRFDVLDVDGDEGAAAFDQWWHEEGLEVDRVTMDAALIVGTPGGGVHFYGERLGAGNRAGMLPRVDWRGNGGYVVAPPSIHPNGGRYLWASGPCGGLWRWPDPLRDLVQARESNASGEWARNPRSSISSTAPTSANVDRDARSTSAYGRGSLRRACASIEGAPEGQRNHTLNREAVGVWSLVAGGEISEADAEAALLGAARAAGLGELESVRTVGSARKRGMSSPRSAPERKR